MRKAEARDHFVSGIVWNLWADYWAGKVAKVPPMTFLRMGGGEDYIFVSAVSEADLDSFLTAVKATPDLEFHRQGEWWLRPEFWFGSWVVFSATIRQGFYGIERRIFANEQVWDFFQSGHPGLTPLRDDKGIDEKPL